MGHRRFKYTNKDLPEILPIFPLSGALLLPGGDLPLNIFEERYLKMVQDALASNRMIGIIQPKPEQTANVKADNDTSDVFSVGCAGQISSFTENADGRILMTLTGICRFKVDKELPVDLPYRRVKANWTPFYAADLTPSRCCLAEARPRLMTLLEPYLNQHDMFVDFDKIDDVPDDRLMTCLSMICPFDKAEQQALLEARNQKERCSILMTMLDFALKDLENKQKQ